MNKYLDEITQQEIEEIELAYKKEQDELDSFEISNEVANALLEALRTE